jgi:galactokinase/mevalonate kinase-like predicted kinase
MPDGFRIAQMAREAENSLPGGLTGLQDQLSAVFGGVNMWKWHYARQAQPFDRRVLLCEYDIDWLSRRIAVAFSGDLRNSSSVSMQYIEDYLAGKTCQEWIEICGMVSMFAAALQEKDGEAALKALQGEMRMRDQICADLWPASALALKAAADRFGCVTRTGGGNRAGCIWSFGEPEAIAALKKEWGNACLCAEVVSAGLELTCRKGD